MSTLPTRSRSVGSGKLFWLAVAACVFTWIMLLIGGTVNPTGSSLACPNWEFTWAMIPLCKGEILPAMEGGVLYEHGHRLWGWLVGLATTAVVLGAWLDKRVHKRTKWLTVGALLMVLLQGLLGGLTVKFKLDPIVSTGHLLLGYLFLGMMLFIAWRLLPRHRSDPARGTRLPRGLILAGLVLVLAQVIVGGAMRHYGAGMVCGADPIACGPLGLWPELGLGKLHMAHRFLGYIVLAVILWVGFSARRAALAADRPIARRLAWAPALLVIVQVALGLATITTGKSVAIVTLHTAVGGLIVASMLALTLAFGPLGDSGAAQPDDADDAVLGLEEAHA